MVKNIHQACAGLQPADADGPRRAKNIWVKDVRRTQPGEHFWYRGPSKEVGGKENADNEQSTFAEAPIAVLDNPFAAELGDILLWGRTRCRHQPEDVAFRGQRPAIGELTLQKVAE
ncbi:MAG: hypothetical protein ABSD29_03640 [Verrucomicrobiota bacterium]